MGRRRPFVQPSYLTDLQFSVVAAVGRTGTLAFRVAYNAFGEARHLPAKDVNGDGKVDKTDTTLAQAASGKKLGQQGEAAVRAIRDIGPKKPIVVNGRRRIPDGMNRTTLTEIKNVKSLSYTQQLRDYADYANENGLVFELWMPRGVEMSRTLRDEIDAGRIVPQWIPGT